MKSARFPDAVSIYAQNLPRADKAELGDARVTFAPERGNLNVYLEADKTAVRYIRLRWNFAEDEAPRDAVRVLGDAWERGYGDLEWRGIVPQRCMPWVCAASNGSDAEQDVSGRRTDCFGVRVRPGAMCFWQYDAAGVTLWLDVRCGGAGVELNGRRLLASEVVCAEYCDMSAFDALKRFYARLCTDAILPDKPVYGFNNWYYAYGKSSRAEILRDATELADLCRGIENRPFMVIDDGWEPNSCDYPWIANEKFRDMKRLADDIKALDVRPGIWIRFLTDGKRLSNAPDSARLARDATFLDPSHPFVKRMVAEHTHRLVDWGYELIKHDYSTFDIFGKWGFQCADALTDDGWRFYDKSRTSAEIVVDFYKTIREAAGKNALILGCNAIGHLAAGLVELNRTGDDTSGRQWDRTRKMGVNTLAFRMLHDKAFYGADADCAAFTDKIDMRLGLEWMDLLSKSGTSLFVSLAPGALDASGMAALRAALRRNGEGNDALRPVDWMENITPARFDLNGKEIRYNWYPKSGAESFAPDAD